MIGVSQIDTNFYNMVSKESTEGGSKVDCYSFCAEKQATHGHQFSVHELKGSEIRQLSFASDAFFSNKFNGFAFKEELQVSLSACDDLLASVRPA